MPFVKIGQKGARPENRKTLFYRPFEVSDGTDSQEC